MKVLACLLISIVALAQDAVELSQRAASAMRSQRFGEAETLYRKLISLDPSNPMWRMNLGLALHSNGRFAPAIKEFEAFAKARPQAGPVHLLLGTAHLKLGQACAAIPPLEKAAGWNKERSQLELADAYYACKRFERAARTYEAVGTRAAARQAAHCYWQARLYPDAKRIFQTLEQAFDREAEFQYEYGDTLARVDGPEAGLPYLRRAVDAKPALIAARGELGKALLATGDAAGAVPHLEAASRGDATLLLPLSRAYRESGREAEAGRVLKEYRTKTEAK
ncbi:MAG: tetratricopeptide repeat protein [Bryobacterales bacterium]|nr:tetratricopeptide repeat protein [Bryobacterales bacterium]